MISVASLGAPLIAKIATGAAIVAMVGVGVQQYRIMSLQAEMATKQSLFDTALRLHEEVARKATDRNRELEQTMAASAAENRDALDTERETNRLLRGAFAAERDRMRDSIAGFAAGRGLTPKAAADTCSERAAALGRSLDATLRAEEDLVEQLEGQRSDTRTLLRDARIVREVK